MTHKQTREEDLGFCCEPICGGALGPYCTPPVVGLAVGALGGWFGGWFDSKNFPARQRDDVLSSCESGVLSADPRKDAFVVEHLDVDPVSICSEAKRRESRCHFSNVLLDRI